MAEEIAFTAPVKSPPQEMGHERIAELSDAQKIKMGICPSCGNKLVFQEGCKTCYSCGWGGCE